MNVHETDEALSAHLDEEDGAADRARIESHLSLCDECSFRSQMMQQARAAVSRLAEVGPTPDESRSIRLAVIEGKKRKVLPRVWALAGGVAMVVAGFTVYAALHQRTPQQTTGAALSRFDEASAPLVFGSDEEVRKAVMSMSEVTEGAARYRVSDVGTKQSGILALYGHSETPKAAGAPAPAEKSAQQSSDLALDSGETGVRLSKGDCLAAILRSRPYAMMPVLAREVRFKSTSAWLFVYAWTSSTSARAPLDRIQVWIISTPDCSPDRPLYYASFTPRG